VKIYCSCCDKVQIVLIDDCLDAKTNKPFQDIVCVECRLVIASGVEIKRTWVGLTDEAIWSEYQTLWPFHPAEEPRLAKDIVKFARAIEAKLKEKNT